MSLSGGGRAAYAYGLTERTESRSWIPPHGLKGLEGTNAGA